MHAREFLTGGLSLLFGLGGIAKLYGLRSFEMQIHQHQLLPPPVVGPVSVFVPVLEVFAGVLLAASLRHAALTRPALVLSGTLLGAFTTYLVLTLVLRGPQIACGCGGLTAARVGYAAGRNLGLVALVIGLAWHLRRRSALSA
jgi:hypothetical protein